MSAVLPRGWILGLLVVIAGCSATSSRLPNVVLIIGDDQGFVDFGFMGSEVVETPALDRLASEGTVFTHGFTTASVCKPSLRSLLTGLHPIQWDAWLKGRSKGVAESSRIQFFRTLPRFLAEQGYASYQAGKFWEASYRVAGFTDGMQREGASAHKGGVGRMIGRDTMEPVYEFIDRHREQPFFLWFSPMLPHLPHDPPEQYRQRYEGRGLTESAVAYYGNATRLDDVVGGLLSHLDARGLTDDTLVIFLSDNGWDQAGDQHARTFSLNAVDGIMGKSSLYELGLRTPIVVRWPERVPAGRVLDHLVSSVDLFPTILSYAGVATPSYAPGKNLRPVIEGGDEAPRRMVVGSMKRARPAVERVHSSAEVDRASAGGFFLRTADWSYVRRAGMDELFSADGEVRRLTNVARRNPGVARRLGEDVEAWRARMLEMVTRAAASTEAD